MLGLWDVGISRSILAMTSHNICEFFNAIINQGQYCEPVIQGTSQDNVRKMRQNRTPMPSPMKISQNLTDFNATGGDINGNF
jgi:hypothetical protein